MPVLEIEAGPEDGRYVIRVRGELDMAGSPLLDKTLEEAEHKCSGAILVNLEELTFIDASGLRSLLVASRRSANNGNRLCLTRGNGVVARMFQLTDLDQALPFVSGGAAGTVAPALDRAT